MKELLQLALDALNSGDVLTRTRAVVELEKAINKEKPSRKFPVPMYVGDDGNTYYDAPHELREEFTIHVKSDGVFFSASCDQALGVHTSGTSLEEVLSDFPLAVKMLAELGAKAALQPPVTQPSNP
jgi:hypothetical protein